MKHHPTSYLQCLLEYMFVLGESEGRLHKNAASHGQKLSRDVATEKASGATEAAAKTPFLLPPSSFLLPLPAAASINAPTVPREEAKHISNSHSSFVYRNLRAARKRGENNRPLPFI